MLRITTRRVLDEFKRRNTRYEVITEMPVSLVRYWHNGQWRLLQSTMPAYTAGSGVVICDQKSVATELARLNGIPVPPTTAYSALPPAEAFLALYGDGGIVVKPADAAHGRGITVGVKAGRLRAAIEEAQRFAGDGGVLLQQKVTGSDLRLLVIGGRFVAAARRVPAAVTGDGTSTIRQLIERENNENPERGDDDIKRFSKIDVDAASRYLGDELDRTVPGAGERVQAVGTANIGAGGHSVDYTDNVSREMIANAEAFARLAGVAVCGVDFIWDETAGRHYFIEGNACPGFNLHIDPVEGEGRPVDRYLVDFLLSEHPAGWMAEAGTSTVEDRA